MSGTSLAGNVTARYSYDVKPVASAWSTLGSIMRLCVVNPTPIPPEYSFDSAGLVERDDAAAEESCVQTDKDWIAPYFYSVITKGTIVSSSGVGCPKQGPAPIWTTSWQRFGAPNGLIWHASCRAPCPTARLHVLGYGRPRLRHVQGRRKSTNRRAQVLRGRLWRQLGPSDEVFAINITAIDDEQSPLKCSWITRLTAVCRRANLSPIHCTSMHCKALFTQWKGPATQALFNGVLRQECPQCGPSVLNSGYLGALAATENLNF